MDAADSDMHAMQFFEYVVPYRILQHFSAL
jgi:hypothetical protein